jgi:hypothetical protein
MVAAPEKNGLHAPLSNAALSAVVALSLFTSPMQASASINSQVSALFQLLFIRVNIGCKLARG